MLSALLTLALLDIWVDPVQGNDAASGTSRATAVRTLDEAWRRIPRETQLTEGVTIQLVAGEHPRASLPNYLESRWGTAAAPIVIRSADGSRTARLRGDLNIYDVRHLALVGLDIVPDPPGDVVHCELCDHFTIRDSHLDGGAREAHETLKVNQSQFVFIEGSDIHGAEDNAIDFVAVQYGHVVDNRIHDAGDWCAYAKGGSAYLRFDSNEIFQCGTGGFTAGQGTGLQFMVSPWLHYEAYAITANHNFIHDTEGAGLGVNGGYNILFAGNRLEQVGRRSHLVEFVHGARSCDGEPGDEGRERCSEYLAAGGWGDTRIPDGENYTRIPNRNVFFLNNSITNASGFSASQHFTIAGPYDGIRADENLQIRGNIIINEGELGAPESIREENHINGVGPILNVPLPRFDWSDAPSRPLVPPPPALTGRRRAVAH